MNLRYAQYDPAQTFDIVAHLVFSFWEYGGHATILSTMGSNRLNELTIL